VITIFIKLYNVNDILHKQAFASEHSVKNCCSALKTEGNSIFFEKNYYPQSLIKKEITLLHQKQFNFTNFNLN
jgi:hypothetical protein